jgi:uncharacterized protein with HEPN domain
MKEDSVYLQHIIECIRRIEENTIKGQEGFMQSHTIQDAVLRNLQTMSEATQRISGAIKAKHPEIEWSRIAAFRNILVHNYLGIDLELIWGITQQDVAELKRTISALLEEGQ